MGKSVSVHSIWDVKSRFLARARENPPVWTDGLPPDGEGAGYQSIELLLLSLASSSGSTLAGLLQKMSQKLTGMDVQVTGERRDEIPAILTSIEIHFTIMGEQIDPRLVERGIDMVREKYCPVWAMLKTGTPIRSSFQLIEVESSPKDAL
jgi:putative redox protein